ncbi:MAG: hypothetical protein K0M63_09300 [Weeksellaceae bacterium]|nr:hypothetical protein [Weeksellaceae bacterium]
MELAKLLRRFLLKRPKFLQRKHPKLPHLLYFFYGIGDPLSRIARDEDEVNYMRFVSRVGQWKFFCCHNDTNINKKNPVFANLFYISLVELAISPLADSSRKNLLCRLGLVN